MIRKLSIFRKYQHRFRHSWKRQDMTSTKGILTLLTSASAYAVNQLHKNPHIYLPGNAVKLRKLYPSRELKVWNDILLSDMPVSSGSWHDTIFVSGFLRSGSSAVADHLNDITALPPIPQEPHAFRADGIPGLLEGNQKLSQFLLKYGFGIHPNPMMTEKALIPHAKRSLNYDYTSLANLYAMFQNEGRVNMANLTRMLLTHCNEPMILDNAVFRQHVNVHVAYPNASWVFVIRDMPDQYAQSARHGDVANFIDFMTLWVGYVAKTMRQSSDKVIWCRFEDFVMSADYRANVLSSLLDRPGERRSRKAEPKPRRLNFVPSDAAKNIGLSKTLDSRTVHSLYEAQERIYDCLPSL